MLRLGCRLRLLLLEHDCDCIAYPYVPAFSLHLAQDDPDVFSHLNEHDIIVCSMGVLRGMYRLHF